MESKQTKHARLRQMDSGRSQRLTRRLIQRFEMWLAVMVCSAGAGLIAVGGSVGEARAESVIAKAEVVEVDIPFEVDLLTLLREEEDVFPNRLEDRIWNIQSTPGKIIMALPLKVEPGDTAYQLDSRTIRMKGGRFLVWRVADADEYVTPDSYDEEVQRENLPTDAVPRVARELEVTPKNTVKWDMERFIPGGEVTRDDLDYAYKLDRKKLDDLRPKKRTNTRRTPGEDSRAYITRSQQERAEWQAENNIYREVQGRVLRLPEEFEVPMPPRLWLVSEVNAFTDEFEFEGPAPLPWTLSRESLEIMQNMADSGAGSKLVEQRSDGQRLTSQGEEYVARLLAMVSTDDHPYTQRLAAYTLASAGLVKYARPNDNLYRLLAKLGTCNDLSAKRVVIKELVETFPPTQATTQLIAITGHDVMDKGMKTIRLNNLVNALTKPATTGQPQNRAKQLQDVLSEANRIFTDPKGPAVTEAIDALVTASRNDSSAFTMFLGGVQFSRVPDSKLDEVITAVAQKTATEPLAAMWFDRQLLGATDPRLVKRTLDVLSSAEQGSAVVGNVFSGLMGLVSSPTEGSAVAQKAALRLDRPIPIDSSRHSIFRALQQGDKDLRDQAWQVLPLFEIAFSETATKTGSRGGRGGMGVPGMSRSPEELLRVYELIMDIGLAQQPNPLALVRFLERQQGEIVPLANDGLVRLVLRGDSRISARASRVLLGSGRDIRGAVEALSYGDRHEFGRRLYKNIKDRTPPAVVGLLRHRLQTSNVASWFAQQVSEGTLPDAALWVNAMNNEAELLELVPSSDEDLAIGAVAAMVASAGGDERAAIGVARALRRLPDQSPGSIASEWQTARQMVYRQRIKNASGPYRMSIAVYEGVVSMGPGQPIDLSRYEPVIDVSLGMVPLTVDGDQVNLGGALTLAIPNDHLAIQLVKPSEIKNLSHPEVTRLPLEQVIEPVDLLPELGGVWRGMIPLPDGRLAELSLEPLTGI